MAFIYRRAILRTRANPVPRVRSGAYILNPLSLPIPIAIALTPTNAPSRSDQAVAGTVIGIASVTTSDGSTFTGTLGFAPPFQNASGLLLIATASLTLTRNLTPTDIGIANFTVSATENGVTLFASFALTIVGGELLVDPAGDVQAVDPAGDTLIVQ